MTPQRGTFWYTPVRVSEGNIFFLSVFNPLLELRYASEFLCSLSSPNSVTKYTYRSMRQERAESDGVFIFVVSFLEKKLGA